MPKPFKIYNKSIGGVKLFEQFVANYRMRVDLRNGGFLWSVKIIKNVPFCFIFLHFNFYRKYPIIKHFDEKAAGILLKSFLYGREGEARTLRIVEI